MSSSIKIKRSEVSGNPAVLGAGELAYSALPDNGTNGGDRLYIGTGTETNGNAVKHVIIGGKRYTDLVDAATHLATTGTLVRRDTNGNIEVNSITGALVGNASTATKLATARTFDITGDATWQTTFDGSQNVTGTLTLATVNSTVGSFGDSVTVPTVVVNGKGLVTSVTTSAIPRASTAVKGLAQFDSAQFSVVGGLATIVEIDGGTY